MATEATREQIVSVMRAISRWDGFEDVTWRFGANGYESPVFTVGCNDLFFWGCSDAEPLTSSDVLEWDAAHEACAALDSAGPRGYLEVYGSSLYCCRKRAMRPQKPYLRGLPPRLVPLFEACGPEREA